MRLRLTCGLLSGLALVVAPAAALDPQTYGTADTSYHRVGFSEFGPEASSFGYSDLFFGGRFARYAQGSAAYLVAVAHLPSGALVEQVEFDFCDTNAGADITFFVWGTDYLGGTLTGLGQVSSSGAPGCGLLVAGVPGGFTIDNNLNQLVLQVALPDGSSTAIAGAIVRYRLQVSPAPVAATFGDVPTSHPFFQYVEALVDSGITAGCGSGNYCPNAPLTRGQMAVFLAKALGLHFP